MPPRDFPGATRNGSSPPFTTMLTPPSSKISFGSMWLMRYVDARFSWLLTLSSSLMALTFYAQTFFVLRELLGARRPA